VDVLMHTPRRFSDVVRAAVTEAAASLRPLRVAPRFHCHEVIEPGGLAERMRLIARRGTQGIVLKAPDDPVVVAAVDEVVARGVPVVTFVTDLPGSRRDAYVGIDNRAAGHTAAFLLGRFVGGASAAVIANLGSHLFRGEEDREHGFRSLMSSRFPALSVVELTEGYGLDRNTRRMTREILACTPDPIAVYSMGGGNRGILQAFDEVHRRPVAFVGHDLDEENRALVEEGRIDAVVDHDLAADARTALTILLRRQQHREVEPPRASRAVIVTPWNL